MLKKIPLLLAIIFFQQHSFAKCLHSENSGDIDKQTTDVSYKACLIHSSNQPNKDFAWVQTLTFEDVKITIVNFLRAGEVVDKAKVVDQLD